MKKSDVDLDLNELEEMAREDIEAERQALADGLENMSLNGC